MTSNMKGILKDYIRAVGSYVVLITGGLVATLIISSLIGYLPYSDRPGPGWVGPSLSFDLVRYYLSWGTLVMLPTVLYGTALFAYNRFIMFFGAPHGLVRAVATLTAALVSLLLAAGMGWYIALAAFPSWIASALGAAWGAVVLPRYLGPRHATLKPQVRAVALGAALLALPLTVYAAASGAGKGHVFELIMIQLAGAGEGSNPATQTPVLEPSERTLLDSLYPGGHWYHLMSGTSWAGAGTDTSRVLIVFTGSIRAKADLRIPGRGSVVYVQQGDHWDMFPRDVSTRRKRITLGPTDKSGEVWVKGGGWERAVYELKPSHTTPAPPNDQSEVDEHAVRDGGAG